MLARIFSKKKEKVVAALPPVEAVGPLSAAQLRQRDINKLIQTILSDNLNVFDPQVKSELEKIFPDTDMFLLSRMTGVMFAAIKRNSAEYAADFMMIMQLIENNELVKSYLDELELCLQKHAEAIGCSDYLEKGVDGKLKFKDGDTKKYKILSSFLYQWAKENGFQHIAKIAKNLDVKDFLNVLSSQTFFKEIGPEFASGHGSWSHAIQWFVIIMHYQKTNCFSHHPVDIYRQFGEREKTNAPLWGKILDLYNGDAFSSPEYLNRFFTNPIYLKENEQRWPLIVGTNQRQKFKADKTEKQHKRKYGRSYRAGVINIESHNKVKLRA